jgi:Putative stress-induced transcription regulator
MNMKAQSNADGAPSDAGRRPVDATPIWPGTQRYGFRPAPPGGLALVQDFLNTRPHAPKEPDLLGSGEDARAWAATAMGNWSVLRGMQCPALTLTDDDAARLRELRDILDALLTGNSANPPRHVLGAADLTLGAGEMSWMPSGYGWRWLGSAIVGEVVMSQETGTWRRMKQCRNPHCRATFYDSSWNNRGVCRHPSATSAC